MNYRFLILLRSSLLFGLAILQAAPLRAAGDLKAGVGRSVITPKQDMWLGGYAARKEPSSGKLHDLHAKALAFEDETGARTVLVTTDLLGLPAEVSRQTAQMIQEKFGIPRERLMLTSSHTHSGPVIRKNLEDMYPLDEEQRKRVEEYSDSLPGLFSQAVESALKNLEPCKLSWGIGEAGFAINRRQPAQDGVNIRVNPKGPVDHDVPVLKVETAAGALKALVMSYACHNTTLDIQQINGDYAGFAQLDLESRYPGTTALFMAGCAGDQNPDPRRTIELAQKHGVELAGSVAAVLKDEMREIRGPIRAYFKEIPLKLSPPPSREELEKQTQSADVYVQRRARGLLATLDAKGALDTVYPYPIQVLDFGGGLDWIALGGEVVVDYALRLKRELGRERIWIVAYANDVPAYIPSLRVLKEGGYEGGGAMVYYGLYGPWDESVEEEIVRAVHGLAGR